MKVVPGRRRGPVRAVVDVRGTLPGEPSSRYSSTNSLLGFRLAVGIPMEIDPGVASNGGPTVQPEPLTATVTGSGFVQGSTVRIGAVKVLAVRVKSDTQLEVDLGGFQDLPEGALDVEVTRPDGSKSVGKGIFVFVTSLVAGSIEVNQACRCRARPGCRAWRDTTRWSAPARCATVRPVPPLTRPSPGSCTWTQGGAPIDGSPFLATPASISAAPRETGTDFDLEEQLRRFNGLDQLNFPFRTRLLAEGTYEAALEIDPRKPGEPPERVASPDTKHHLVRRWGPWTFRKSPASATMKIAVALEGGKWGHVLSAFDFVRGAFRSAVTSCNPFP